MSDYFVGEIRLFGGYYAPDNWALCNGQLLSIQEFPQLYALIGVTYGGDGVKTFALPNLMGSVAIGYGQSADDSTITYPLGQMGGLENVTLTSAQTPTHTHTMYASTGNATSATPSPALALASVASENLLAYTDLSKGQRPTTPTEYGSGAISTEGLTHAHNNMMPSLILTYMIALNGYFPTAD